jgi:outer membrane protein OmpA-like peptidoglycan-associated protein
MAGSLWRFRLTRALIVLAMPFIHAEITNADDLKNIAALNEGGHIVFFSSQYNDSSWKVSQLLDGSTNTGWAGNSGDSQYVIIAFKDNQLAEIEDILINPYSRESKNKWARDIEIEASSTYPFMDYQPLGQMTLANEGDDQVFTLSKPVRARYLKIRFLSNYGGGNMEAGEIQVMGRLLADAPPTPEYKELASAGNGGRIEKFTSAYNSDTWGANNLIEPDGANQWAGKSSGSQEVVVALADASDVTEIAISNYARETSKNWAKDVEFEVSPTFSYKGYVPAGNLSLAQVADLYTASLEKPTTAKYVKVIFRTNHGGGYMETGRIRVFSAPRPQSAEVKQQLEKTGHAVIHEINFATNSAEILEGSETILSQIAQVLNENPDMKIIIEGHTDNIGGDQENMELSEKRADAVKGWLVEHGHIDGKRLTTKGYGMTRPLTDNSTEEGRARNRRVELVTKT